MAVTLSLETKHRVEGNKETYMVSIASGWADGDTIDTGMGSIENIQLTCKDANVVAADAWAATANGGVITLELIGTARAMWLYAIGNPKVS